MKPLSEVLNLPANVLFACLLGISLLACSGEGGGEFDLDRVVGAEHHQVLSIDVRGEIAAIQLDLPYDSKRVESSTISVVFDSPEEVPDDTHIDFSVREGGLVSVGILNGREKD